MSLVGTLVATWLTKPTEQSVLESFYRNVRPFGWWGPVRAAAGTQDAIWRGESMGLAVINSVLGMIAIFTAYVAPMYLVSHFHGRASICAGLSIAAIITLKFTWYDQLPERGTVD